MAGIDKIYGTLKQRLELEVWLVKNQKSIKCDVGCEFDEDDNEQRVYEENLPTEYLYPISLFNEGGGEQRPISNFPEAIDKWLLKNCDIDWVVKRIKEQYNID